MSKIAAIAYIVVAFGCVFRYGYGWCSLLCLQLNGVCGVRSCVLVANVTMAG